MDKKIPSNSHATWTMVNKGDNDIRWFSIPQSLLVENDTHFMAQRTLSYPWFAYNGEVEIFSRKRSAYWKGVCLLYQVVPTAVELLIWEKK